jgi:K+-transporting ATPase KdpF subunit
MRRSMNIEMALGLVMALALTVYLVYAMLRPEKL